MSVYWAIANRDPETLLRWWCDFNSFHWPDDYPEPEPSGWHALTDREKYEHPHGRAAWATLDRLVDRGAALAYWHGPHAATRRRRRERAMRVGTGAGVEVTEDDGATD